MAEGVDGGFAAVYPVLRALEEAGRIRRGYFVEGLGAAQFALAGALDRLRAVREPRERDRRRAAGPPPGRRRSGQPVRRRRSRGRAAARRPAAAAAGRGRVRRARRRRRGALPRARRQLAPDAAGRSTTRPSPTAALGALRALVADGRARELVVARVDGVPVGASPWYETLLGRLRPGYRGLVLRRERAGAMIADAGRRHPRSDRRRAPAVPRRPGRHGARAPACPGPQVRRIVGQKIDAVDAAGKNLLIRFDNGLELRTHLRLHGSWHRYRPGETWRRPPSRAAPRPRGPGRGRRLLRAPVVELFERRAEASTRRSRCSGRTCSTRASTRPRRSAGCATRRAPDRDRRGAPRPARARRHRQRLQERGPVHRAGRPVRRTRTLARPSRPPTAARQRRSVDHGADERSHGGNGRSGRSTAGPVARPSIGKTGRTPPPAHLPG